MCIKLKSSKFMPFVDPEKSRLSKNRIFRIFQKNAENCE